jgi:hypothetical protein
VVLVIQMYPVGISDFISTGIEQCCQERAVIKVLLAFEAPSITSHAISQYYTCNKTAPS